MSRARCLASLPLVALAGLAFAMPARADAAEDDDAGTIVVTGHHSPDQIASGTKTETPLLDTPQSVVVLGRERLDDQGAEGLGEALRYIPGVTLGQGEGHRDQVVMRGQASTADFFLDGLRDDAQYYRPLYNTQQVEVLKGANALLFGRGGGGGVVNRTSKQARLAARSASLSGGVDSFGAWSVAGDVNLPVSDAAALRLNATYEGLDNDRDLFGGHFIGVAPTLTLVPAEGTRVIVAYEYDRDRRAIDRGVPSLNGAPITGYEQTFFGSAAINRGTVDAHVARVRLEQELAEGLTLDMTGQYAHYDKYYGNILPGASTGTTVSFSGYESSNTRSNWIGQTNLVWKGELGGIGHTLLVGVELGEQDSTATRRNALFAQAGGGTAATLALPLGQTFTFPAITWTGLVTDGVSSVSTRSIYVQDQIELAPWVQVIGGVRYDRFVIAATNRLLSLPSTRTDHTWSPRLGLVLKPQDNLSFYASYAKSFLPQAGDQFSSLDPSYQSLAPEEFRNLEAGFKWDARPDLSLTVAVFQLDRRNTRVTDPANPGFWVLTGSSRTWGFETALSGKITPRWELSLGGTWQKGEIRSATNAAPAGRALDKLPRHQSSLWSRYQLTDHFGLGLGVVHQSSQFASIGPATPTAGLVRVTLPAYTRIDAAAYLDLSDRVALQLNVENLTDTRYFASAHTDNNIQPGDPINVKLTARLKF